MTIALVNPGMIQEQEKFALAACRCSRGQGLTLRTDVTVVLGILGEVRARERSIGALAPVLDRNVRIDAVIDEPTEQSACAVGPIGSQVVKN